MKVTFSNLGQRWPIECTDGITAYVENAADALDAHATVTVIAEAMADRVEPRGLDHLKAGHVCACIIGNTVFKR